MELTQEQKSKLQELATSIDGVLNATEKMVDKTMELNNSALVPTVIHEPLSKIVNSINELMEIRIFLKTITK